MINKRQSLLGGLTSLIQALAFLNDPLAFLSSSPFFGLKALQEWL